MIHLFKHHRIAMLTILVILIVLIAISITFTGWSIYQVYSNVNNIAAIEATGTWIIGDITLIAGFLYFLSDYAKDINVVFEFDDAKQVYYFQALNENKRPLAYRFSGLYFSNDKPSVRTLKNLADNDKTDGKDFATGDFLNEFVVCSKEYGWIALPPYSVSKRREIPSFQTLPETDQYKYCTIILVNDDGNPYTYLQNIS